MVGDEIQTCPAVACLFPIVRPCVVEPFGAICVSCLDISDGVFPVVPFRL